MKKNDIKALHDKTINELRADLEKLTFELAKARLEKGAGRLADVAKVGRLADDIARTKTIIGEKVLNEVKKTIEKEDKE